jgi:hypothetical protein
MSAALAASLDGLLTKGGGIVQVGGDLGLADRDSRCLATLSVP